MPATKPMPMVSAAQITTAGALPRRKRPLGICPAPAARLT